MTDECISKLAAKITSKFIFISLFSLTIAQMAQAEQAQVFGDYTVHYSAFTTDNLTASVAKQYNITRSKKRALLNISILKKTTDGLSKPIKATIKGTATNLSQQLRELNLREISEKGAIYYITDTLIDNAETLKYKLEITPEGSRIPYKLSFQEQFYTE